PSHVCRCRIAHRSHERAFHHATHPHHYPKEREWIIALLGRKRDPVRLLPRCPVLSGSDRTVCERFSQRRPLSIEAAVQVGRDRRPPGTRARRRRPWPHPCPRAGSSTRFERRASPSSRSATGRTTIATTSAPGGPSTA